MAWQVALLKERAVAMAVREYRPLGSAPRKFRTSMVRPTERAGLGIPHRVS
jgi:hypothetical protein